MSKTALVIVYEKNSYNDLYDVLFSDILSTPDVYKVTEKTLPEKGVWRLLLSQKVRKNASFLVGIIYEKYYLLPKEIRELGKKYDHIKILFHNASLRRTRYPIELLSRIKSSKVSLNLLYLDPCLDEVVCGYANMLCEKGVFDKVLTIDRNDAIDFNLEHCLTPYSKIQLEKQEMTSGLYFCGQNKGRLYILYSIWREALKHNVRIGYDLMWCQQFEDFFESYSGIQFHNQYVSYREVLRKAVRTNCILDVIQKGQSALTLRPYEAVVYKKKLLTNNPNIFEFPYYNPSYMHYFEKIEEIDWEWVLREESIDYNYAGDFSPIHLVSKLV